jgi:hypothetical protein
VRLAVPDVDAATALARTWAEGASAVASWETAPLYGAERLLRAGDADLAFVPTLAVLRNPDDFAVVPGVGLVGSAYGPVMLDVRSGLDSLRRIGFDPHYAQEVLLAQVLLKELYQAQPQFVPVQSGAPVPTDLDARLRVGDAAEPAADVLSLDLAREWFELTTRPFVWALLAAPIGTVTADEARLLRDEALLDSPPPDLGTEPSIGGITLAAYAHAGLDEWVNYLFYHRALDALPEIPFVVIPEDDA